MCSRTGARFIPLATLVKLFTVPGAFRLRDAGQYDAFYGFSHPERALLAEAVYGLPELGSRERTRQALSR